MHIVYYDCKVVDKVMVANHTAYKYETPSKGHFLRKHCFTSGTVNLKCGAVKITYNIHYIKTYKSYTKLDNVFRKKCLTMSKNELPVIYFCLKSKFGKKYIVG